MELENALRDLKEAQVQMQHKTKQETSLHNQILQQKQQIMQLEQQKQSLQEKTMQLSKQSGQRQQPAFEPTRDKSPLGNNYELGKPGNVHS